MILFAETYEVRDNFGVESTRGSSRLVSPETRSQIETDLLILGGGIAGLSLACFLDREATVLEREKTVGGLSRSYRLNGVAYDVGPHIIFSKNKEILDLHTTLIETSTIRRSNQIV